jgi:hypothetical protein
MRVSILFVFVCVYVWPSVMLLNRYRPNEASMSYQEEVRTWQEVGAHQGSLPAREEERERVENSV